MDPEIAKTREELKRMEQQLASFTSVTFDTDLYGGSDKDSYLTFIDNEVARKLTSNTAPKSLLKDMPSANIGFKKLQRIIHSDGDYHKRLNQLISSERHDPFNVGWKTPNSLMRTYADVTRGEETLKLLSQRRRRGRKRPLKLLQRRHNSEEEEQD